jgi:hypothetical protein
MDGKKEPFNDFFKLTTLGRRKFGPSMNQMDGKFKTFQQFLQTKCPREKGTFPKKETKWYLQPCSPRGKD